MLSRRNLLAGLFAAPAVVAIDSLMPLRGIKFDPVVRLQSWPIGDDKFGEWWVHEGPLSQFHRIEVEMRSLMGACYSETVYEPPYGRGPTISDKYGNRFLGAIEYGDKPVSASRLGVSPTREEMAEHSRKASKRYNYDDHGNFLSDDEYVARCAKKYNEIFVVTEGGRLCRKELYEREKNWIDRFGVAYDRQTNDLIELAWKNHKLGGLDVSWLGERVPSHIRRRTNTNA